MFKYRKSAFLFLGALAANVQAAPEIWYPEEGTWRNPAAQGRNFKITIQDRTLILNIFSYRADGSSVNYQAVGPLIDHGSVQTFSAVANEYANGQCLGCPYTTPENIGPNGGSITITFDSISTGHVNWEGEQFDVARSNVVVGPPPEALLGTWIFNYQISTTSADTYTLTELQPATDANGTGVAAGVSDTGDVARAECYVAGAYAGRCLLVEEDGTTAEVEKVFEFDLAINNVRGEYIIPQSGVPYPMWGFRIAGRQDAAASVQSSLQAASLAGGNTADNAAGDSGISPVLAEHVKSLRAQR